MKAPLVGLLIALVFGAAAFSSWLQDRKIDWKSKPFQMGLILIIVAVFGPIVYQYFSERQLHRDLEDAQRRAKSAEIIANEASAKAHVFRFDGATLTAIGNTLKASGPKHVVVGCSGNLDAACPQLEAAFQKAGWSNVAMIRNAPFWGSSSAADQHGAFVSYGPGMKDVAKGIAGALEGAGFDAVIQANANASDPDLQIALIYRATTD